MTVPTVAPTPTPVLPAIPVDPFWEGFWRGWWIAAAICAALIIAFLIGRYAELPARRPKWYREHIESRRK